MGAISALLAALLAAGCATATRESRATAPTSASRESTPAPPALERPRPTRDVLGNGVVLITQEHRAGDAVAIQLWMRVGGRDEAPDEVGLSHYLEHMLFKGTATRPPGSIDALIEGLGGRSNAFTSYDYTHFDVLLPAEHVRTGLELLADIAVNAAFDPKELDNEKQVVLEEMRLVEDDPDRFLVRRVYELGYRPHPYGRPLLGTPEMVRSLTRERLHAYYAKHYVPRNMVVVVVGAVTPAEVRPLADATFGRLVGPAAARAVVPPPPRLDAARREDVRRTEREGYLGLAWRAAATSGADSHAVDLLMTILGDSPSSRLNQTVRERERLVNTIDTGYGAWALAGLVTVTARLEPGNADRAEAAILDVIRRVRAEGVTEAERRRAVVSTESSYAFDIETAEGLAKTYGEAETTWTLENELGYLARLREITAGQIQEAAKRYLGDGDYARVRFLPGETPR